MIDAARLLAGLPQGLRDELLASYREIVSNYLERRWEPAELNGGKFCEVVYSILHGLLNGSMPQRGKQTCKHDQRMSGPGKGTNRRNACG